MAKAPQKSKAPALDKAKGKKPILMIKIGIGKPVKDKKGK